MAVHDGDTLTVEFLPRRANVRLLNCWAPEVTGPQKALGLKSKSHLKSLALDQECVVFIPYEDRYQDLTSMGRVLGFVFVNQQDLSEAQVQAAMAAATKKDSIIMFGPVHG